MDDPGDFEDVNLSRVDLLRGDADFQEKPQSQLVGDRDSGLGSTLTSRERRDTESHGPYRRSVHNQSLNSSGSPSLSSERNGRGAEKGSPQRLDNRTSQGPAVIRRNQVVTQLDLFNSAERIYARYMMENAEKPVYFP